MTTKPHILFREDRDGIYSEFMIFPDGRVAATAKYLECSCTVIVEGLQISYEMPSISEDDKRAMDKAMNASRDVMRRVQIDRTSVPQPAGFM